MGRRAIDAGMKGGPFAFLIPPDQHDPHAAAKLANCLLGSKVEVDQALEPFRADGEIYPAGSVIIFMAQPFRAYVKTLLERQDYPERRTAPGRLRSGRTMPPAGRCRFRWASTCSPSSEASSLPR